MGLPDQYCPVCGGPFKSCKVYDEVVGNGDLRDYWASVILEDKMQWLEEYRLIGRTKSLHGFCADQFEQPKNYSKIKDFFISEHAFHSRGNGYMFEINGAKYRAFQPNRNRDVLFPIHDACLDLIDHVLRWQNLYTAASAPSLTLETFYEKLCGQYLKNMSMVHQSQYEYGMFGLEWEHGYYGARDMQNYNGWGGYHGQEWYCADPSKVNLTSYVLGLLSRTGTPETFELERISPPNRNDLTPREKSRLERLPTEIMDAISAALSMPSIVSLRMCSRTLAARLYPDQQFFFQRLLHGNLVPFIWDLDKKECFTKIRPSQASAGLICGNWRALAKQSRKGQGDFSTAPIGFRNRCRIWRIIEEAMSL